MNAARAGVQIEPRPAAVDGTAELVPVYGALDRQRKISADRTRAGAGHQRELGTLWETHRDPAGAAVDVPIADLLAFSFNVAAAGMCSQRPRDFADADTSGAGLKIQVRFCGVCKRVCRGRR